MIDIAWPFVALCFLACASYFANRLTRCDVTRRELREAVESCKGIEARVGGEHMALKLRIDRLEVAKIGRVG